MYPYNGNSEFVLSVCNLATGKTSLFYLFATLQWEKQVCFIRLQPCNGKNKFVLSVCTPTTGTPSSFYPFVPLQRERRVRFIRLYPYNGKNEFVLSVCTPTTGTPSSFYPFVPLQQKNRTQFIRLQACNESTETIKSLKYKHQALSPSLTTHRLIDSPTHRLFIPSQRHHRRHERQSIGHRHTRPYPIDMQETGQQKQ